MKFKSFILAGVLLAFSTMQVLAQATLLPLGEQCFSALAPTSGGSGSTGTGFIGLLGTITGGSGGTAGTYGGVPLTGGSGSNATANITVSGGIVTQVAILNPGVGYVVGDVLSAASANIGSVAGFSVPVSSVSINYSLAGGSVTYYIPSTTTFKQTWQNSAETIPNTNPVTLDANGCAIVYGAGIYRQILKDSLGNTVWDQLTAATGPSGIFWAGAAGGTGNAITVVDTAFANQDGATIQFRAIAGNTGPATIAVSGGTPIAVVIDTSSGPAALSGGEIGIGNTPMVTYDATNVEFHIVNPSATTGSSGTTSSLSPPQGYLNLVGQASGDVLQTGDAIGVSTVFYSPFVGNTIPIWNGSVFKSVVFSELTATLTAAGSPSSTIQDSCVFSNNGVPTLVTGPSWTTVAAGSGARGTGAGTAQLTRLQGIWVNAVSIVGYNGLSSFTIPANQCTYVGSLYMDATAGQVSAYVTSGLPRKFGIWNAYNRQQITIVESDSNVGWNYNTNVWRQADAGTTTNNYIDVFSGLPEEPYEIEYIDTSFSNTLASSGSNQPIIGVGYNSTSSPSIGVEGRYLFSNGAAGSVVAGWQADAKYFAPRSIGVNRTYPLENGNSSSGVEFLGSPFMQFTAKWRG